jgi:ribose/xylose/arabinose/galactoside ABC-type transport system permease subunit
MNNGHSIGGFPASYVYLGNGSVLGVPVSDLLLIVMMGIGIFITQLTPIGNRIYALGGNETVVRQEGINVDGLKLFVYMFSGFCASIAGILLSAQLDTVHPIQGEPYLLDAIAACVIGGVSLAGGTGRVALAVAGALIIGSLRNVLDLLGFTPFSRMFWSGRLSSGGFRLWPVSLETRGPRMRRIINRVLKNGSAVILVLLTLVGIVFVRNFATIDNGAIIARQSAIPAIAVLGMTMVLMTGGNDLSVGFVVGLASTATYQRRKRRHAPPSFAPGGRPNGPSGAPDIGIHRRRGHCFGLVSCPPDRVRPGTERFRFQPMCRLPERPSDTARVNVLTTSSAAAWPRLPACF